MCKTKIVATLGPASQTREKLTQLIQAGVNVVRLNFSHGSAEEHIARAEMVREIAQDLTLALVYSLTYKVPKFVSLALSKAQFSSKQVILSFSTAHSTEMLARKNASVWITQS